MDKLSEYLPLIIIIGSIIYSIVKGANRKKAEEELAKTTLPGHTGGKEIYFPAMNEPPQPVYKEQKKSKAITIQTPVYQQKMDSLPTTLSVDSELEGWETDGLHLGDADEIKKAIIYTEIFRRKEY